VKDGAQLEKERIAVWASGPAESCNYVMLNGHDLLLVTPQDGTVAEVIHLDRPAIAGGLTAQPAVPGGCAV
jgi:hypothetical protein